MPYQWFIMHYTKYHILSEEMHSKVLSVSKKKSLQSSQQYDR